MFLHPKRDGKCACSRIGVVSDGGNEGKFLVRPYGICCRSLFALYEPLDLAFVVDTALAAQPVALDG